MKAATGTRRSILRKISLYFCSRTLNEEQGHAILTIRKARAHKRRPTLPIGGADPPDERKEGDANVCYISGLGSDWNIHCSPRGIVLYDLSRKEIAATTRNSDLTPKS